MYKSFFGLKENPFNVNPDPHFLYQTQEIQEALACLTYGINRRRGFILLSGEVGQEKPPFSTSCWNIYAGSAWRQRLFLIRASVSINSCISCWRILGFPANLA